MTKVLGMPAIQQYAKRAIPACVALLTTAFSSTIAVADNYEQDQTRTIVIAQTSMGLPGPPPETAPGIAAPTTSPSTGYTPPGPNRPDTSANSWWGAIAFTADGSYSSVWKMATQAEAEASVAKQCSEYGRGGCKVASFSGQDCVGLATFIGQYRRRRWALSFTAGGTTYPEAQRAAMASCNSDERSQGQCQSRTAACADGR